MTATLIIVESPTKAKKIQEMLGPGYIVRASLGHIRDLPNDSMGVYPPDFKPTYVPTDTGKTAISRLKEAAKTADEIYLASDPDREGEAIGWHLAQVLRLKSPQRVTYNEITEQAIKAALKAARPLDMHLVAAQEARRVIDRLVGFRVSPVLSSALNEQASSGRVQTPALFLIVQRERAIRSFFPVNHYGCDFFFQGWKASWNTKNWLAAGSAYITDRAIAEAIGKTHSFVVEEYTEKETQESPPPPFITSTLQRAGEKALNITIKEVMASAQRLFEGGYITYMRTDSPTLSTEAVSAIREYCAAKGWPIESKIRTWKSKDSAQAAHEAIRPTHIEVEEAGENEQDKALYRLIRLRTLATQLPDAVFAVRSVVLQAKTDVKEISVKATGRAKILPGWTALMKNAAEDEPDTEREAESSNPIPKLSKGQTIQPERAVVTDKKTAPPARYSESSLVDALEAQGIGRPATYSAILTTLYDSHFATLNKKILSPTPLGERIITALEGRFSFVDLDFTKRLEELLDNISEGKQTYGAVISALNNRLDTELRAFMDALKYEKCPRCSEYLRPVKNSHICTNMLCSKDFPCPTCGKPTHYIRTPKGESLSCADYPSCKGSYLMQDGKPIPATAKK